MLIYNFQKEFLGIDEKELKIFGFNTLAELRDEVTDFADLFVKTPGYVHNFKHVHWIDFISYADVSEESKVLININSKTFKATVTISTIFLIDNPSKPAYAVHLKHLRVLSKSESDDLSSNVLDRELPKVEPQEAKVFTPAPKVTTPYIPDEYDNEEVSYDEPSYEEPSYEEPVQEKEPEKIDLDAMLDVGDLSVDTGMQDDEEDSFSQAHAPEIKEPEIKAPEIQVPTVNKPKSQAQTQDLDDTYTYDPHIASKELGLPIDLIEEFIQDFIAQAGDFKNDIYTAIEQADVDTVKTLSHKLKGVAANLRIEDAYEVLSNVSATSDMGIIHENLNTFYKIISKLAGEPEVEESVAVVEEFAPEAEEVTPDEEEILPDIVEVAENEPDNEEMLELDFKDDDFTEKENDVIEINDSDVPDKIDIPELADDDFLNMSILEDTVEEEPIETKDDSFHYSKEEVAKEIGLSKENFDELFEDFTNESHSIFQKINAAISNDDYETCKKEAIKFKGMSDNMRLHEFTPELETLIHSSNKEKIAQAIKKIDTSITKISKIGA
jgi:HPt (histidine-containing phosphotransfer) domain-containing protein